MNENKITIKDLVEEAYKDLTSITIPAKIGADAMLNLSVPIAKAMHNLEICIRAAEINEQQKAEAAAVEDEIETQENVIELPVTTNIDIPENQAEESAEDK